MKKRKIYLAARFGRREELNGYRKVLEAQGHTVTSRWLTQHQKLDLNSAAANYSYDERRLFAAHDYEDVLAADTLIAFTEDPLENAPGGRRGGRHVELGMAIISGHQVFVIGYRENVFCWLPHINFYESFAMFLADELGPVVEAGLGEE